MDFSVSSSSTGSPWVTTSPTFFSQRTSRAFSITSPTFGISSATRVTSAAPHQLARRADDFRAPRKQGLFELGSEGNRHKRTAHARHRRIELIEQFTTDARRDLRSNATIEYR